MIVCLELDDLNLVVVVVALFLHLVGLVLETLAADGHVGLLPSDQLNIVVRNLRSQCERCLGKTDFANCMQLLDFLTLWNEV